MIRLGGPYPGVGVYVYLPSAQFSDLESGLGTVEFKRSMSGNVRYSYVKSRSAERRLGVRVQMNRAKALELRSFIELFFNKKIEVLDHEGYTWIGYLLTNPNEFETIGVSRGVDSIGFSRAEIQLEFRGSKQ